jgi:hypothetical protein
MLRAPLQRTRTVGEPGTDEQALYKVDFNGNGYRTEGDYDERRNKMEYDQSDGQWYPRQYGK